jgi:DNA-binding winged helix-turn-helix (wHTH) protein/serine/threonine protein kinase
MGHSVWRFADCEFDEGRRELRVGGQLVDVEVKPLDVLHQLLLHADEVVTKDELLEAVWPRTVVVDGSLATAVSKLRKALRDERLVVNVPRIGYRLTVPAQRSVVEPPEWPAMLLSPGDRVPHRPQWRLERRLGVSPSSEVWLAQHEKTREPRVFKFAPDAERLRNLKREVTLARLLRESIGERPEFVRLLEWNFEAHPCFVESEYAGPTLTEWAAGEGGIAAVPPERRIRILATIVDAVATAHEAGVLHKDLKPDNILVSRGPDGLPIVKVSDFGSAALLDQQRLGAFGITNLGFTQTGIGDTSPAGTAMYMAPEVFGGQTPTAASDVYALGVLLYQMAIGDLRRPLAPGWEADVSDPLLQLDIADAACGDPGRRIASAAALRDRLLQLDIRRREYAERDLAQQRATQDRHRLNRSRDRGRRLVVAAALLITAMTVGTWLYRSGGAPVPPGRTVAVLPFQNVDADAGIDFLRLALPDEVATILSRSSQLSVRPLSAASRYDAPDLDVENAGREMGVRYVVTGRFMRADGLLRITLVGVDLERNQIVWQDRIDAPADSLIAAQVQIAIRVKDGLVPALGAPAVEADSRPRDEEAYRLYLRSLAVPLDPGPNPGAIELLERAVARDTGYAPAWVALGRRYYVEGRYARDDAAMISRYSDALERAVALDPDYIAPMAGLISVRVERGDLASAYADAVALVDRHPSSVDAQYALSYVLRFAGLLDDAGRHCDRAFLIDAQTQTSGLRSCAVVFLLRGDYPHAANYLALARGTSFEKALTIHMYLRQGRAQEALAIGSPEIPQWNSYELALACAARRPQEDVHALVQLVRPANDPETNYFTAGHLAYCGQDDAALQLLRDAVHAGYCAVPAMDLDPLFADLRTRPEYAGIRADAQACQQHFLADTQVRSEPPPPAGAGSSGAMQQRWVARP